MSRASNDPAAGAGSKPTEPPKKDETSKELTEKELNAVSGGQTASSPSPNLTFQKIEY